MKLKDYGTQLYLCGGQGIQDRKVGIETIEWMRDREPSPYGERHLFAEVVVTQYVRGTITFHLIKREWTVATYSGKKAVIADIYDADHLYDLFIKTFEELLAEQDSENEV